MAHGLRAAAASAGNPGDRETETEDSPRGALCCRAPIELVGASPVGDGDVAYDCR